MKIKGKKRVYEYKNDVLETLKIDKKIRDDISELCKKKRMNKSKLIEEFYKTILLRFRDGSMNAFSGYITMNILREPIRKNS